MRIRHDVRDVGLARRLGLAAAALLAAIGYGDEGASVVALPASPGESDEPLYLIQTRVFAPDSTTGVLIPTFHPAAVLRGGGEPMAQMRADFVRAKQALAA